MGFSTSVIFIPAGVNSFPRCQSRRAVKHTSDHNLHPVLSDQSRGCYHSQYVMVRNDTMAAAGLLVHADYARPRTESILLPGGRR